MTGKTILFAGLIITLMIPVTGISDAYTIKPQIDCESQIQIAMQNVVDISEKQYKNNHKISDINSEIKFTKKHAENVYDFKGMTVGGIIDLENCTVQPLSITASFNSKADDKHVLVEELDADLNHIDVVLKEKRYIHAQKYLKNWSGKVLWTGAEDTTKINEAKTTTTVPNVQALTGVDDPECGTGPNTCVISNWIGISRDWNGHDLMFQGGVDTECKSACTTAANEPSFGWWEVIDNGSHAAGMDCENSQLPSLNEDDAITITTEFKPTNNRYYFTLKDGDDFCAANYSSSVQPKYAQYIVERVTDSKTNLLANITKFDPISHKGYYKDGTGTRYGINTAESASNMHTVRMTHDGSSGGITNVDVGSVDSKHKFIATWYSSRLAS